VRARAERAKQENLKGRDRKRAVNRPLGHNRVRREKTGYGIPRVARGRPISGGRLVEASPTKLGRTLRESAWEWRCEKPEIWAGPLQRSYVQGMGKIRCSGFQSRRDSHARVGRKFWRGNVKVKSSQGLGAAIRKLRVGKETENCMGGTVVTVTDPQGDIMTRSCCKKLSVGLWNGN